MKNVFNEGTLSDETARASRIVDMNITQHGVRNMHGTERKSGGENATTVGSANHHINDVRVNTLSRLLEILANSGRILVIFMSFWYNFNDIH